MLRVEFEAPAGRSHNDALSSGMSMTGARESVSLQAERLGIVRVRQQLMELALFLQTCLPMDAAAAPLCPLLTPLPPTAPGLTSSCSGCPAPPCLARDARASAHSSARCVRLPLVSAPQDAVPDSGPSRGLRNLPH